MKILQDPAFKAAVKALPEKEKDKLLLRLLRFDDILMEKIYFEQVDVQTVDFYRLQIEEKILRELKPKNGEYFYPYLLVKKMRKASGIINRHVRVTTDKFGEPYLNLLMLNQILYQYQRRLLIGNEITYQDFNKYFIGRLLRTLKQISGLDEDLHLDFQTELEKIAVMLEELPVVSKSIQETGISLEELKDGQIPLEISEITAYAKEISII